MIFLFMMFLFLAFFIIGAIPLFVLLKIKKDGVLTNAKIFNVRQVSKASTRSTGAYSADIRFRTKAGRIVQASYQSSGDYLTLFQENKKQEAEIVYARKRPSEFYFPKDKGDIGWNIICFSIGIVGIMITVLFVR